MRWVGWAVTDGWAVGLFRCYCSSAGSRFARSHPARPRAFTTMVSVELQRLMDKATVPGELKAFLERESLTTPPDIALLTSEEAKVDEVFLEPAKAGGVPLDRLASNVSLRKLWRFCRDALQSDTYALGSQPSAVADTTPLPDGIGLPIKEEWGKHHNFRVPKGRLVISTQMNHIHTEIHAQPPRFPMYLLQQIRFAGGLGKQGATALLVQSGQPVTGGTVYSDEVTHHYELYLRMRAFFTSICWCVIKTPEWYSLSDNEHFLDKILTLLHTRYQGQRPPVGYFVEAYVGTMHIFQENVDTHGHTLAAAVKATTEWIHLWSSWTPSQGGSNTAGSRPDLPTDLQRELDKARATSKQLQSERDRVVSELSKYPGWQQSSQNRQTPKHQHQQHHSEYQPPRGQQPKGNVPWQHSGSDGSRSGRKRGRH